MRYFTPLKSLMTHFIDYGLLNFTLYLQNSLICKYIRTMTKMKVVLFLTFMFSLILIKGRNFHGGQDIADTRKGNV